MSKFEADIQLKGEALPTFSTAVRAPIPPSELDLALTARMLVAWAGEAGEETRLGWWRSDCLSEFGGQDLFQRMLPNTWRWAVLEGAMEAARRRDAELRIQDHDPDRIVSLYCAGFEVEERIGQRLMDHKQSGREPKAVLPGLALLEGGWNRTTFTEWVTSHGAAQVTPAPLGRWLKGEPPATLDQQVQRLVAALAPLGDTYPLPHFRRAR